jgi:parallel beta-helix repeat protein
MATKTPLIVSLIVVLVGILSGTLSTQGVEVNATVYIRSDGRIDPPTVPISSLDSITYTFNDDIYDSIVIERDNIVVNGTGYVLQGMGIAGSKGILLTGRNNITISNMKITAFDCGIYLHESTNTRMLENNITDNWDGIYLRSSSNNFIVGNNITANNDDGIGLYRSTNNIIARNHMVSNNWRGIWLYDASNNNEISGNNIAANKEEDGIWLGNSSYNFIVGNNITANNDDGILIAWSSNYNNIVGNNIANNNYGIYVLDSSENSIYHNNFSTNTKQVHAENSSNLWDSSYPSGGNYWSDHNPADEDSDRIGDLAYIIDENNFDPYPLIYPYGFVPKPDVTEDGTVNIIDIATVATAFGCEPGDERWNPMTDMDMNEIVNIIDIADVARNFG